MTTPLDQAWSNLEPGCAEIAKGARAVDHANQLIFLSAATSLKRIADALTLSAPLAPANIRDTLRDIAENLKG